MIDTRLAFHAEHEAKPQMHAAFRPPDCDLCWPEGPPSPEDFEPVATQRSGRMESLGDVIERLQARFPRLANADMSLLNQINVKQDDGPDCDVCHGTRRVRKDVPVGDPDFGRALECESDVCRAYLGHRKVERLLEKIPDLFQRWTLEEVATAHPDPSVGKRLAQIGYDWLGLDNHAWLLLHGRTGRGKTVLAIAIIKEASLQGLSVSYQEVTGLLRRIRRTYRSRDGYNSDEMDILAALYEVDVLVLDDLGKENDTDWASELLAEVIHGRHERRKRTIITSNYDLEELETRIGQPAASRIMELTPRNLRFDFSKLESLRQQESVIL